MFMGFRVIGFRVTGFRAWGLGYMGFGVWGSVSNQAAQARSALVARLVLWLFPYIKTLNPKPLNP